MELTYKAAAAALVASVIGLLIKKRNPEIAILLSAVTVTAILTASTGLLGGLQELRELLKSITGENERIITPVLKCLGIAIVTKTAAELCKDSSQNAAAAAVELAGTVCAMTTVMPLLMSVLKMIGGMV